MCGCGSPSITQSALKILCRQCSEFACANIISSTSVGLRPSAREVLDQVVDLVVATARAPARVRALERRAPAAEHVDRRERLRRRRARNSRSASSNDVEHGLGHAIVDAAAASARAFAARQAARRRASRPSTRCRARCARPPRAPQCARCRSPSTTTARSCRGAARRAAACRLRGGCARSRAVGEQALERARSSASSGARETATKCQNSACDCARRADGVR